MFFQSIDFFIFFTIVACLYYRPPVYIQWSAGAAAVLFPLIKYGGSARTIAASLFIAVCIGIVSVLKKTNSSVYGKQILLLIASLLFYCSFYLGTALVSILLTVSLLTYISTGMISKSSSDKERTAYITIGIILVLLPLAVFKYSIFFLENITECFQLQDSPLSSTFAFMFLSIFAPVGISFYSFKAISCLIDVYRRRIEPPGSFIDVATYVSFFPALLSGPIDRAGDYFSQLKEAKKASPDLVKSGVLLIIAGLLKKLLIADGLKPIVDQAFSSPHQYSSLSLLIAAYCYSFQIYCDFAGYTDMAIGTARILGFRLPPNFMRPYFTTNISEFWRRWHMSLSSWLRDYLYIPLGGSRGSILMISRNLLITMLLAGLWHGASWNFVFWGGFHGMLLIIHRLYTLNLKRANRQRSTTLLSWFFWMLVNFNLISLAWVFFRADSWDNAMAVLMRIAHGSNGLMVPYLFPLVLIPLFLITEMVQARVSIIERLVHCPRLSRMLIYGSIILLVMLLTTNPQVSFVYFAF